MPQFMQRLFSKNSTCWQLSQEKSFKGWLGSTRETRAGQHSRLRGEYPKSVNERAGWGECLTEVVPGWD
jgi:hypothetical protein